MNSRARFTVRYLAPALALGLLAAGCSGDPGAGPGDAGVTDGDATICGPTLRPVGPACVPILDECPGDQVPIPGGGCKRIGVAPCKGGISAPPDWTCKPPGPTGKCPAGWTWSERGWCQPILPQGPCPQGTMEVIGQATCQPVRDCAAGAWGSIQTTAGTIFVDQSYAGAKTDGSAGKPFKTLEAALADRADLAQRHIAVAAGTYKGDVRFQHKGKRDLVIDGRCPTMVTLEGEDARGYAVEVNNGTITLRGLTITGPGGGVRVSGDGAVARIDRSIVLDSRASGVWARDGGTAELLDSLVAGAALRGALAAGGKLSLLRSVVRDAQPLASGSLGLGVSTIFDAGRPASLTMRDSLVSNNRAAGLVVFEAEGTVDRSVIRATRAQLSNGEGGQGVLVWVQGDRPARLTLRDSLVSDNQETGVAVRGATALVERTAIVDTRLTASDRYGLGVSAIVWQEQPAGAVLRDCVVADNHMMGVEVFGAKVLLERSIVTRTRPSPSHGGGWGFSVGEHEGVAGALTLKDCLVEANHFLGAGVSGSSTAALERTIVRDTRLGYLKEDPGKLIGPAGYGINVSKDSDASQAPRLDTTDCLVEKSVGVGFQLFATRARLIRTVVRETLPTLESGSVGVQGFYSRGSPTELTIEDSRVDDTHTAGVMSWSSNTVIRRSEILNSRAHVGAYGDGVFAGKKPGDYWTPSSWRGRLEVTDTLIDRAHRVGVLFASSSGALRRSVVQHGQLPAAIDDANPSIDDNVFTCNQDNRLYTGLGLRHPEPIVIPGAPELHD